MLLSDVAVQRRILIKKLFASTQSIQDMDYWSSFVPVLWLNEAFPDSFKPVREEVAAIIHGFLFLPHRIDWWSIIYAHACSHPKITKEILLSLESIFPAYWTHAPTGLSICWLFQQFLLNPPLTKNTFSLGHPTPDLWYNDLHRIYVEYIGQHFLTPNAVPPFLHVALVLLIQLIHLYVKKGVLYFFYF
ncbi:hypothetical protein HMI55_006784 [Coelomomyces lativittatus]|nr:hypothetical protein HMI55_006784 [Coelomomyces lativittatus]